MTTYFLDPISGIFKCNLLEFESCASGLQGRNDFRNIVRNKAKSSICMVLLNNYIERKLLLLKANWAVFVIMSASSKIINFSFRLLLFWLFCTLSVLLCLRTSLFPHEQPQFLFNHLHLVTSPCAWNLSKTSYEQQLLLSMSSQYLEDRRRAG